MRSAVVPADKRPVRGVAERLRLFDQATRRQQKRQGGGRARRATDRGWTREQLYERRAR